jgi:hypothetical protein
MRVVVQVVYRPFTGRLPTVYGALHRLGGYWSNANMGWVTLMGVCVHERVSLCMCVFGAGGQALKGQGLMLMLSLYAGWPGLVGAFGTPAVGSACPVQTATGRDWPVARQQSSPLRPPWAEPVLPHRPATHRRRPGGSLKSASLLPWRLATLAPRYPGALPLWPRRYSGASPRLATLAPRYPGASPLWRLA